MVAVRSAEDSPCGQEISRNTVFPGRIEHFLNRVSWKNMVAMWANSEGKRNRQTGGSRCNFGDQSERSVAISLACLTNASPRKKSLIFSGKCFGTTNAVTSLLLWIERRHTLRRRHNHGLTHNPVCTCFTYPRTLPTGTPTKKYGTTSSTPS